MGETPRLIYQVAVGEVPAFYGDCLASVARYAARIGADHVVQTEPILRIVPQKSARSANALRLGYLPIYEKEVAFSYLDRYERVLVLDADVWVRPTAPDIFGELGEAAFAAVFEREMPLTDKYREKIRKHSTAQFGELRDVDWQWNADGADFANMGVMLLGQPLRPYLEEPARFLRRPEFARFVNGEGHWRWSTDQTLLNWWLKREGIPVRHLDWRWNALYGAVTDIGQAHFVHIFLSAKLTPTQIAQAMR